MYATQLKIFSVAFFSGCRPLLSGLLSAKRGQVTGLFGRGSGMALLEGPDPPGPLEELQAASSELAPPAPSSRLLAVAPWRRKLRRDTPGIGGVPSGCQPSLGCMVCQPFAQIARCNSDRCVAVARRAAAASAPLPWALNGPSITPDYS